MRIRVFRNANSCIYHDSKHAAGVCLSTIQARTHNQLALVCQQSMLKVQHKLLLTMQQCTAVQGIWEMNVLIMPPHLRLSAWYQVIAYQHVGFVITLIALLALLLATMKSGCI